MKITDKAIATLLTQIVEQVDELDHHPALTDDEHETLRMAQESLRAMRTFRQTPKQSAHKTAELLRMGKLVGRTVASVGYDDVNDIGQPIEGVYTLRFTDGTEANFSSCGDDMTHTTMDFGDEDCEYVSTGGPR